MNFDKAEIKPKIFSDHNSIEVVWQWNRNPRGRWRLNDALLLHNDVISEKDLEEFFKINNAGVSPATFCRNK